MNDPNYSGEELERDLGRLVKMGLLEPTVAIRDGSLQVRYTPTAEGIREVRKKRRRWTESIFRNFLGRDSA